MRKAAFIFMLVLGILYVGYVQAYSPPFSVYYQREDVLTIHDCYPSAAPGDYLTLMLVIDNEVAYYVCDRGDAFKVLPPQDVPHGFDYHNYTTVKRIGE